MTITRTLVPALLLSLSLLPVAAAASVVATDGPAAEKRIETPRPDRFSVCYRHSCRSSRQTGLTAAEWRTLQALFTPPPADAAGERRRIKRYIGMMETLVGPRTGTQDDLPGTFRGSFQEGQMDCIDETMNTTTYLTLLIDAGTLRFHRLRPSARRGLFISGGGWKHASAVIEETATGQKYAVDSWFYKNGVPPEILPLEAWLNEWNPPPSYTPKRFVPLNPDATR